MDQLETAAEHFPCYSIVDEMFFLVDDHHYSDPRKLN